MGGAQVGMSAKVRKVNGAWWVDTHHAGRRRKKRVGPTAADKREAEKIAKKINAALALCTFASSNVEAEQVPFLTFAQTWLRQEIELPISLGHEGLPAPRGSAGASPATGP